MSTQRLHLLCDDDIVFEMIKAVIKSLIQYTVELQWLQHLWNHENIFEAVVVRADEYSS